MNDQILSLVSECQRGIQELREHLELRIATQKKPIGAARVLRYLGSLESGEIVTTYEFASYENITATCFNNDLITSWRIFFIRNKRFSEAAKSLLLKMHCRKEFEFFRRYVFACDEESKRRPL
jgi:hypothetical protein